MIYEVQLLFILTFGLFSVLSGFWMNQKTRPGPINKFRK